MADAKMLNSMKDKKHFWFGLVRYTVVSSAEDLINRAAGSSLQLYRLESTEHGCSFFCPIDQKKLVRSLFPNALEHETTGVLGFLFKELKRPFHLFLMVWAFFLYTVLNHTILEIEWLSTSSKLKNEMENYLLSEGITKGTFVSDSSFDELLKSSLKKNFIHELSWLEVNRSGSLLKISFNHKESKDIHQLDHVPLVSYKHAMVVRFDVLHGNKCVQKYQIVEPGDVLVDCYLTDSSGNTKELFVMGKVFGLTWYTVTSELHDRQSIEVFDYVRLLYDCRKQIEQEIDQDEQILKENILQVSLSEGKIRMVIHYTCLEDITKQ